MNKMSVSNQEILAFLAQLLDGEVPIREIESFLSRAKYDLSDDAFDAITLYLDDADSRNRDLIYDLRCRMDLLDVYMSYKNGEYFSTEQYFRTFAQRLRCCYSSACTDRSIVFRAKRLFLRGFWSIQFEFSKGAVQVTTKSGSWLNPFKTTMCHLYDGSWLNLAFHGCTDSGKIL